MPSQPVAGWSKDSLEIAMNTATAATPVASPAPASWGAFKTPLFPLGQVVATPGALNAISESAQTAGEFLTRHHCGDWGLVPPSDHAQNNENISQEGMLHSSYKTRNDTVIWVITEWDRSVTTILLPSEY